MKHIKVFEQIKEQELWLMIYDIIKGESNYMVFDDEESCKNTIIDIINDERSELYKSREEDYTDDKYLTDYDDAINWYELTIMDATINYQKIKISPKFDGSERFKRLKETRKYNL